jgi:hypothetical protein
MRRILALSVFVLFFIMLSSATALAGKNAGGALIVHTDDNVWYTHTGQYCGAQFSDPGTCENAVTRTDKDENTPAVIWLLAAFPDTANPAVSVVYFGIEHNLGEGSIVNHGYCGPAGSLEIPDAGWPDTGLGNSLAFGSPVQGDILFPFYWLAVYGTTGSYLGTAENPTGGYAAFVDNSDPPVEDQITRFGTVRWHAEGPNVCPGGDGGAGDQGGIDTPGELDGDGDREWERDCILVQLREDLPLPPREPARLLGVASFDTLSRAAGILSLRRVISLPDDLCGRYPISSHIIKLQFQSDSDEEDLAAQYAQLPEVVSAHPNYAFPVTFYDEWTNKQGYLGGSVVSCLDYDQPSWSCCPTCDIGVDEAWATLTRGNPNVKVAFVDSGADMQHPDLFNAYAFNPGEDVNGNDIPDLCPTEETGGGDINGVDDDQNGVIDDVMLGYAIVGDGLGQYHREWVHWHNMRSDDHGTKVAGLLGAVTGNNEGIASVAGGAHPIPGVRLIQFSIRTDMLSAAAEIEMFAYAAASGARVFSTSAALQTWGNVPAVVRELSSSMTFVAAVGNNGQEGFENGFAALPEVIAAGGYDCRTGGRWVVKGSKWVNGWKGSDYGPGLSVMGPTNDDHDYGYGNGYTRMVMASPLSVTPEEPQQPPAYDCVNNWSDAKACFGGTSAAAPIVSSIAALVWSYLYDHYEMPPFYPVRTILERTAEDIQCDSTLVSSGCDCSNPQPHCAVDLLGWDMYSGFGRIDAGRALTLPVAILQPLSLPHPGGAFRGETIHLSWGAMDINTENGDLVGDGAHFELDCLIPERPDNLWFTIDHAIDPATRSYDWVLPNDLPAGLVRRIRLTIADSGIPSNVNLEYSAERFWVGDPITSVDSTELGGAGIALWIAPNPTSGGVRIVYQLGTAAEARLSVFDVGGRRVKSLAHPRGVKGPFSSDWSGDDEHGRRVESGIYFIRLESGSETRIARLVRLN